MFLTQRIFDDLCKEYNLTSCPSLYVMRMIIGGGHEIDEDSLRRWMAISSSRFSSKETFNQQMKLKL